MPKKSKKPMKKAVVRVAPRSVAKRPAAAKPAPRATKRSAVARPEAKAQVQVQPKKAAPKQAQPKKAQPKPQAKKAQAKPQVKKALPKAKLRAQAKPAVRVKVAPKAIVPRKAAAKVAASPKPSSRALILPPKPKRPSRPVLAPPAPRTPRLIEPIDDAIEVLAVPRAPVTSASWQRANDALTRLGRPPLSDAQRVAVRAALEGQDSLVVLANDERAITCYQLAAQLLDAPTVVLSPVVAELKAQQVELIRRELPVACVLPELAGPERSSALARIARGGSMLVLLSPESLRSPEVRQALKKSGIGLFAVEEAQCAALGSHEQRPSYAELGKTLHELDAPPVMALTRVATRAVRRDITERLQLRAPVTVSEPAVPSNLQLVTKLARGEGRQASLVRLVERLPLPGLVLCATPHDVDSVYAALRGAGIATHRQHSGMTPEDRAASVSGFVAAGQRSVMVAVSAFAPGSGLPGIGDSGDGGFGRGPSRADLRFVVHYQSPASLEQYVREIQRAGTDGAPALCVLIHESSHRSLHEVMLAQQRFKATHLAELGRALESPALEGRTVTVESLALGTGQSRRTMDRLTALLADAGIVSRTGGWVRVLCTAEELDEACRRLGAQLYALREQDARRLASVSALAEASECKLSCLAQYLGDGPSEPCGRCSTCSPEILTPSQESLVPQAASRRAVVQEFSVQAVDHSRSAVARSGELTAQLADFTRPGAR